MLKKILTLMLIILSLSYITIYADIADEITQSCIIDAGKSIANILDGRYTTGCSFQENELITISSDKNIKAIYILWDSIPSNWSLINNDTQKTIMSFTDTNDIYLHQLIKIKVNTNNVSLKIDSGRCKIAEIYLFEDGYLPSFVQNWNNPHEKADMLLLSTHADDEHIFFGGTMPYYAGELKLRVQVAYLTNHYNYRVHELLNGLWEVGIRAYPIIPKFYDYYAESLEEAKSLYDVEEILSYQVELLRKFKPSVVIGHDLKGEYGHGVHMLNSHTLVKALEMSNDNTKFPDSVQKYGLWDVPKCYLHLYKENKLSMNWDIPLKSFDNKTAFEMATIGFSKHISQQEFFSVGKKGVFNCMAFGLFRSNVGEDKVKNDFLENINIKKHNLNKLTIDLEK